jgi:response regulator RpfG family c-di-GMP phosphodiesterase
VKFLVLDDSAENRFLLSRTILRRFPRATLIEPNDLAHTLALLKMGGIDLLIVHRTFEHTALEIVQQVRAVDPVTPLIAVSSAARGEEMLAAGASRFHLLDEWLMIGNSAEELLASKERETV